MAYSLLDMEICTLHDQKPFEVCREREPYGVNKQMIESPVSQAPLFVSTISVPNKDLVCWARHYCRKGREQAEHGDLDKRLTGRTGA